MSRLTAAVLALWISSCWGTNASTKEVVATEEPAPPSVQRRVGAGTVELHAHLPGPIVSWVAADGPRATGGIWMLVGPPPPPDEDEEDEEERKGDPCPELPRASLWHLTTDPAGPEEADARLRELDLAIPPDAHLLRAMDLDGDGTTRLLVQRTGELLELVAKEPESGGYALETRVANPNLRAGATTDSPGDASWIVATGIGTAQVYRAGGGGLESMATVKLPIRANGWDGGIYVQSPVPRWVDTDSRGEAFIVTDVESIGRQRFRTHVLRPEAGSEEEQLEECWGRYPEPEIGLRHYLRTLDGEPVAVAITMPPGQVNMFGEVQVRVFPLKADRSRTGHLPIAAFKSRVNLIQLESLDPRFRDVDGDGAEDLLLHHREGFDGEGLELDVYLREPDGGGFRRKPRTTAFKVKSGEIRDVAFGADLDGDGLPDLLVLAQDELRVHPGLAKGKKLVSSDPVRQVDLPRNTGEFNDGVVINISPSGINSRSVGHPPARMRIVAPEGDGSPYAVIVRGVHRGTARLSVVRFTETEGE